MKRFRTYDLAVAFYQQCQGITLPGYAKNQLLRSALSVALNLREARGRGHAPRPEAFLSYRNGLGSRMSGTS